MNFISIITLMGAGQGIFLTATLFFWQRGNTRANILLGVLFATMTISLINAFLLSSGLYATWTLTIRWYDVLRLLTGPLIYLYVREMVLLPLRWRDALHFLPSLLYALWLLPFFLGADAEKIRFVEQTLQGKSSEYIIFAALRPWYNLAYLLFALLLLRRYSRQIRERFANVDAVSLQWLWNIVLGVTALVVFTGTVSLLTFSGIVRPMQINFGLSIIGTLWMYGIAFFALQKSMNFSDELRRLLTEPISLEEEEQQIHNVQVELFGTEVFGKTRTDEPLRDEAKDISQERSIRAEQLLRFMEEKKPYLDSQLTIQKLADASGIPMYRISEILNKEIGQNFFDFVNRHRVEEWIRHQETESGLLTIQELAFQVGFNSKSSFNTAFKKHTGQTPSQYRSRQLRS